jgi:hypothetical protein
MGAWSAGGTRMPGILFFNQELMKSGICGVVASER